MRELPYSENLPRELKDLTDKEELEAEKLLMGQYEKTISEFLQEIENTATQSGEVHLFYLDI